MKTGSFRNNFTSGVLDPALSARFDLEKYRSSLAVGRNIVIKPQGSARRRGGFRTRSGVRGVLRPIALTAGMLAASKGGTVGNVLDFDTSTALVTVQTVTGDPWSFLEIDLGAAAPVCFVDLVDFRCQLLQADDALAVQWSATGVTWSTFGKQVNVRATSRTRRFGLAPGSSQSARYWRVVVRGGAALGTLTVGELRLWQETARTGAVELVDFTFSPTQSYIWVVTDRNVDVFRSAVWQAALPIPHRSDQLGLLTKTSGADTTLLFHPDVWTRNILRQGAHDEWDSRPQVFSNVPDFASGTTFTGTQDAVQRVTLTGLPTGGTFTLAVEEPVTLPITATGSTIALAAAIKAALEALPNVADGLVVVVETFTSSQLSFTVRFEGGANAARVWPPIGVDPISHEATWSVAEVQDGRTSSGDIMSARAGWPRCGTFFGGRLYVGGFRLRPQTLIGSLINAPFDFSTAINNASGMVEFTLDSDEVSTIHAIHAGDYLQVFTDTGEWWVSNRVIERGASVNFVSGSRFGIAPGTAVVSVEGQTFFLSPASGEEVSDLSDLSDREIARETVLRSFRYDLGSENYTTEAVSLLTDVIKTATQLAYQRSADKVGGTNVFLVNDNGSLAVLRVLGAQDVQAFVTWDTAGDAIRSIAVDGARKVYAAVERGGRLWLEELVAQSVLDASVYRFDAGGGTFTTVSGIAHLEGRTVGLLGDGDWLGTALVSAGQVTLPRAVNTVEVGLAFESELEIMPLRRVLQSGEVVDETMRVAWVRLALVGTGHVAIAANGGPFEEVPLPRLHTDDFVSPMLERLYTGHVQVDGLRGHGRSGRLRIGQLRPAPWQVTELHLGVGHGGK